MGGESRRLGLTQALHVLGKPGQANFFAEVSDAALLPLLRTSIHSTAELAKHLGLSRWSVSRALNGGGGVSAETVARVQAAMAELRFTPSPHARALVGRRTGTIGISFRALDTAVNIVKLAALQRHLGDAGFRPLFEVIELDQRRGDDVIGHFISMRVEAALLIDIRPGPDALNWRTQLRRAKIPAVYFEPLGDLADNTVQLDRTAGMEAVTNIFLAKEHRRFALLGIDPTAGMGRPRYAGIARALKQHGLNPNTCCQIINLPHGRPAGLRYGQRLGEALLALPGPRPTAVLAVNDEVAAGALWALQRAGVRFPDEMSICGFDNSALTEQTSPGLSSVDHRVETCAAAAVKMLLTAIERGPAARIANVKISPELVTRPSIGPAPSRRHPPG